MFHRITSACAPRANAGQANVAERLVADRIDDEGIEGVRR
jgi:hypothetical protein